MQFEIRDLGARRFQDATIFAPSNGDTILRRIGLPHAELLNWNIFLGTPTSKSVE